MATDATNQMRAMIAELMGSAGSQIPDEKKTEKHEINRLKENVRDARNCRMFLLGTCPHEILDSTRYDIGQCRHRHEFALRADYNTLAKDNLIDFEDAIHVLFEFADVKQALSNLQYFLRRHRSKIDQLAEQLKRVQDELSTEVRTKANAVLNLNEEIGKKLAEVEKLGSEGKTDECEKTMREVEELKTQKRHAEFELRQSTPSSLEQQQKLRVCEICAAYIGINDNDQRLADHFGGKLHLGFLKLIENEAKLAASVKAKEAVKEEQRKKRLTEREQKDGSQRSSNRRSGSQPRDDVRSKSSSTSRHGRDFRRTIGVDRSSPSPVRVTKTPLSPPIVLSRRDETNGRRHDFREDVAKSTNSADCKRQPTRRYENEEDNHDDGSRKPVHRNTYHGRRTDDHGRPRELNPKRHDADADRRQRRQTSSSSSSSTTSSGSHKLKADVRRKASVPNRSSKNKTGNQRSDRGRRKSTEKRRRHSSSSSSASSLSSLTSVLTSSSPASSGSSGSVSRRYRNSKKAKSARNDTFKSKREDAGRRRDIDEQSSRASNEDEQLSIKHADKRRKSSNGVEQPVKSGVSQN